MKTVRIFIVAASALLLASCAKEKSNPASAGQAQINAGFATEKATLVDGGSKVYWEAGDKISVFYYDANLEFKSLNTKNAATAVFSSVQSIIFGFNEGADNVELYGLYPYYEYAYCGGGYIGTTLPNYQLARDGSFGHDAAIAMAKSNSTNMAFYNFNGGLRFTLQNEGITSITLKSNGGEGIAGFFNAYFDGNVPVLNQVITPADCITLYAPDLGTFKTGVWYYISALPVKLESGFTMTFEKAASTGTKVVSDPVEFKRNTYGSKGNIDEGVEFEGTGAKAGWVVSGNGTVAGLVDDNLATYWQVDDTSVPQSVTIDLGKKLSLNKLIFNNGGNVHDWPLNLTCATAITLELSTDKVSWNTVLSTDTARNPYKQEFAFSDTQARYARLTVTAYGTPGNQLRVAEIDLCGSSYASGDNGCTFHDFLNNVYPFEGEDFTLPEWWGPYPNRLGKLKYWTHENTNGISYDNTLGTIFSVPYVNSTNGKVFQTFYLLPGLYEYVIGIGSYTCGDGQEQTMNAHIVASKGNTLTDIDKLDSDPNCLSHMELEHTAAWIGKSLWIGITEPGYYSVGWVYTTNATESWETMGINQSHLNQYDAD